MSQVQTVPWQPTSKQGKYQCASCEAVAYCPGCLPIVPLGMQTIRCPQHTETEEKNVSVQKPNRRQYPRPVPPDMQEDGSPNVTTLRTSRARQLHCTTEEVHPTPGTLLPPATRRRFRMGKPGWFILAGMLIVLALWIIMQQFIVPAYSWSQDQWHYGDSRITQMDANVGHGGESHFLAEYYQGSILVVEIPLAHPDHFHVYTLTGLIGGTGTPLITLSVQDINHDGKPDVLVQVEGTSVEHVLFNTGSAFAESEG